ncbi:PREDICTED: general odorant-binding protein 57c [Bactrocera latifrons]|uniref:General odorant-binding protein 57c n=1 Tax=Bactrocera latifrons TaxID=174628 RepID=A0A0K8U7K1_BACLA|nr:PREDICTED: general odorant-binding protein 57c [Bactrocera latifrons]
MYQFGAHEKHATTTAIMSATVLPAGGGKGMPIPGLMWLVLLAVIVGFTLPPGAVALTPTAPTRSFVEACQVKHNITLQELDEFPTDPSPEDIDMKFKCYADCLLNGMGFMNTNGKLDAEALHEWGILNDESYENMLECKAANDMEDDPCEYSFGMMLCARMLNSEENDYNSDEVDEAAEERRRK